MFEEYFRETKLNELGRQIVKRQAFIEWARYAELYSDPVQVSDIQRTFNANSLQRFFLNFVCQLQHPPVIRTLVIRFGHADTV